LGKVGGNRNFGFGKQMAWAGGQALEDRYGDGRYATVAAHIERWGQFAAWARETAGIRDARDVTRETVAAYGEVLGEQVRQGMTSVAYAQNLLSTVNAVLEALRGDRTIRVSPSGLVGQRNHVRRSAPAGLDRGSVHQCAEPLRAAGHDRVAAVVELARDLGLRVREASLLDARGALRQAETRGAINVTEGTKGGRGRQGGRWVPVFDRAIGSLRRAAAAQGSGRNLVPDEKSWRQWNDYLHRVWAVAREQHRLGKLHDLRAAYACERYKQITGCPAPAVAGHRIADRRADRAVRETISRELGHARVDVAAAYVGSGR